MRLLLPPDYIQRAAADIRQAEKRVFLIAMVIADHPATHELIEALESAAKRGVDVTVSADVFTYGEVSGSFLPIRYYSPNAKLVTKMAKQLKSAGVNFHWLGRGRNTVLSGRTHDKWCIVDDVVYSFGGVNVFEGGIHNTDYMFRVVDTRIANRLAYEQDRITKADRTNSNYPSVVFELDEDMLMLDGGIISQSIIYRRAIELAREADKILFVSQYGPTGKLGRILKKKSTHYYFNRVEQADFLNRIMLRIGSIIGRSKTLYKRKTYLHAKFIIFSMKDGTKVAITGSHNFAYTGVLLGTREIALETKNPAVIHQLETFFKEHVA